MASPGGGKIEVTVRGGGILGLSAAWALARRGARVRLVEADRLGAGASGGLVGALTPHVPEAWNEKKAFQLTSLLMAQDWWAGVGAASDLPTGYARIGRLQPLADAASLTLARSRAEGARALWRGLAEWQVLPATGAPWEPVSPSGHLVHDSLSARITPRLALAALAEAFRAAGGEIVLGEAEDRGAVIWATGVRGLEAFAAQSGRAVAGAVKGQAALLRVRAPGLEQISGEGLHIVPHDGGLVAIGSTSEHHWTDPTGTDAALDAVIARARATLPALRGAEVVERWAGLRPRAASRAPIAGPWPGRTGHYILNGGFKIGFGMAPLLAERMADLVLSGRADLPPGFAPEAALARAKPANFSV